MKKICYLIMLLLSAGSWAQSISPQVINAAGDHRPLGSTGITITDNVGEPFTQTLGPNGNLLLTQGFIQPEVLANPEFTLTVFKSDVTCNLKNDASISTSITSTATKYSVAYVWTPSLNCPNSNCASLDSLKAGVYDLKVIVTYTTLSQKRQSDTLYDDDFTILDINGPCRVKIFNGVTLNGDGVNDYLIIENISEFPNNRLSIYNRWGSLLYDAKGYDNLNKFWPSTDEASKLVPSTYFYILDLGDGSKPIKGWLELIKN
jgi:gliding motility-associated-like protein